MTPLLIAMSLAVGILLLWQAVTRVPAPQIKPRKSQQPKFDNWADVVDDMQSAIRAGLSLPQAVSLVAENGPMQLREIFARASQSYNLTGDFKKALLQLSQELGHPASDKFVATLILAHDLGGTDLARLLGTLSQSLRSEAAIRAEISARQSWTVNGARLAIAAPWLTVLVLASQSDAQQAYTSRSGLNVLGFCAFVSVFAYLLMQRIGSLPKEPRTIGIAS